MFGDLPFLALRLFAGAYPLLFLWAAHAHGQALQAFSDLLHGGRDLTWPLTHMILASLACCLSWIATHWEELPSVDLTALEDAANTVCFFLHFLVTICLFVASLMLIWPLLLHPVMWWSVIGFFVACPWWWSMFWDAAR